MSAVNSILHLCHIYIPHLYLCVGANAFCVLYFCLDLCLLVFSCFVCVQYAIIRCVRPTTLLSSSAHYDPRTKPVLRYFFYIYIITCTSHLSFLQDLREQWPLCRLMVMLLNNGKTACVYTCSCRVVFIGFWLSVWEYGQRCECVQQARVWAAASVWVFLCRGAVTAGGGGAVGARRQFTSERHGVAALSPRRAWLAITLTLCTGNFSKQYRTLRRALIAFVSNFKSRILSKTCEPLLLRVWSNRSVYFWIFSKRFGDNVKFSKHSRRCRVNGRSVQHACTTSLVFLLTDFCC